MTKENEKQLESIANELVLKAELMKGMLRMSDNDEHNDILLNIKAEEEMEMFNYLNR